MSATINLHHLKSVRAASAGNTTHWLEMESRDGSYVAVFMPYEVACAMADAFRAAREVKPMEAAE